MIIGGFGCTNKRHSKSTTFVNIWLTCTFCQNVHKKRWLIFYDFECDFSKTPAYPFLDKALFKTHILGGVSGKVL